MPLGSNEKKNSLVNQLGRPVHDLSQCPVQMRVGLCRAGESHVRTKVVPALSAHLTGLAVDANFHSDPVTNLEIKAGNDIRADRGDDTTGFVTEDERFSDLESTVRTVEVVVDYRWSAMRLLFRFWSRVPSGYSSSNGYSRSDPHNPVIATLICTSSGLGAGISLSSCLSSFVSLCPSSYSSPATHPP